MEEKKEFKLNGAPWYIAVGCILIILAAAYTGVLGTDMASVLALCVAIAVIFNEIGERLPIWNSYIGGGLLMVFFGTAVLVQFNLIPKKRKRRASRTRMLKRRMIKLLEKLLSQRDGIHS